MEITMSRKTKKYIIIVAIIAIALYLFVGGSSNGEEQDILIVERNDYSNSVIISGTLQSAQDTNLSFARPGKIATIVVKEGAFVSQGEVIIQLDTQDLILQQQEAQAEQIVAQAEYATSKGAPSKEEQNIKILDIQSRKNELATTLSSFQTYIQDAYITISNEVSLNVDSLFNNRAGNPVFIIQSNLPKRQSIQKARVQLGEDLTQLSSLIYTTNNEIGDTIAISPTLIQSATLLKKLTAKSLVFADNILPLIDNGITTGYTEEEVREWKKLVNQFRVEVGEIQGGIINFERQVQSNITAVESAQLEYLQLINGESTQTQLSKYAKVLQAQTRLDRVILDIQDSSIIAPFDGFISNIDVVVGQQVDAADTIARIVSRNLEVTSEVSEIDIPFIQVETPVSIYTKVLDETFEGVATYVSPTETQDRTTTSYKTTFALLEIDDRLKTGMTAEITLETQSFKNIISIPNKYVTKEPLGENKQFVYVREGEKYVKRYITSGRALIGHTEIVNGLIPGDIIAIVKK